MYVLDEPSIGLHQRDNDRLIGTLLYLRDLGNSVLVVEHDEDMIRASDHVIDIGPGAGVHGGQIIAQGTPVEIEANPNSLTGQYLSGKKSIAVPKKRLVPDDRWIYY
jgi:excinuclease ABC subunit A